MGHAARVEGWIGWQGGFYGGRTMMFFGLKVLMNSLGSLRKSSRSMMSLKEYPTCTAARVVSGTTGGGGEGGRVGSPSTSRQIPAGKMAADLWRGTGSGAFFYFGIFGGFGNEVCSTLSEAGRM